MFSREGMVQVMEVKDHRLKTLVASCPEAFAAILLRRARLKTTGKWASEFQRQAPDGDGFVLTGELITELQESDLDLETLLAGITIIGRLATEFQGSNLDANALYDSQWSERVFAHMKCNMRKALTFQ